MHSTLFKANKLLLIEKRQQHYLTPRQLPLEYRKLIIPAASKYFREDDESEILSQHINAGAFSLWVHDIFAKENIILLPYTPLHILALHYMYEDSLQAHVKKPGDFTLAEKECNLFNLPPGAHRVPMVCGKKILSVHINIQPHQLPKLISKFPTLAFLAGSEQRHEAGTINQQPYHINAICDYLIQKILSCRHMGAHALHFLERCCADLFLNFAEQQSSYHQPFLFTNVLHMDTYLQLVRYLIDHPHKNHSNADLAFMFELPENELSLGFRQHFSISIEAFSHMVKLMMTYNLLQKKYVTIEQVANAAGFPDIDEMISEVEEYYGCDVRGLRRE